MSPMAEPAKVTAVPAVSAVRRSDGVQPARALRGTDAPASTVPRPDAAALLPEDVARFEQLVFGQPDHAARVAWHGAAGALGGHPGADHRPQGRAEPGQVQAASPMALTPADRIAATLHHLSLVRGL